MVRTIPPKPQIGNNTARHTETVKKLRVAAYVRVSTENEEQQTSFEAQYEHYYDYITNHPAWEFAGIYADDGISGTNTKNRDEFNRMIEDCEAGTIDMIITKSISRFARNTVDSLTTVRYPRARMRRLAMDSALDYSADAFPALPPYLHLLGAQKDALPLLKAAALPVSHSLARLAEQNVPCRAVVDAQLRACDFGALCRKKPEPMGSALRQKIIFLTK